MSKDAEKVQDAPTRNVGATGAKKPARRSGAVAPREGGKRATRAPSGAKKAKRPSGLDAAAKVLQEASEPLDCKTIVERAFEKGYWRSSGKTPWATVYSSILRHIQKEDDQARFRKAARGKFELAK